MISEVLMSQHVLYGGAKYFSPTLLVTFSSAGPGALAQWTYGTIHIFLQIWSGERSATAAAAAGTFPEVKDPNLSRTHLVPNPSRTKGG